MRTVFAVIATAALVGCAPVPSPQTVALLPAVQQQSQVADMAIQDFICRRVDFDPEML